MNAWIIFALAIKQAKAYTDSVFNAIKGGMDYKGSVASAASLPTATQSIKGHVYTTTDNGHEHVCDGTTWIDLSADLTSLNERISVLEGPLFPSGRL